MIEEFYPWIKILHIACAVVSISGFTLRGLLKLRGSRVLRQRWIRIVPHINDSLLLAFGVYLALSLQLDPGASAWLKAKLVALLLYILLGMVVMRFARTRRQQLLALLAALLCFAYIAAVAVTRNPWPL